MDPSALFFNFNYTSTLSQLYGIDPQQILHIHGRADDSDEELVLGHAWDPRSRRSLNDRPDIEEVDTRMVEANDIIDDYFSSTFKRSEELIRQHSAFFDALTNIEQVVVLGHSLSEVDALYFQALLGRPSVATSQWTVACRKAEEWPAKQARLIEMGLRQGAALPVFWQAL